MVWEEMWSKSRNRPYYFNPETGESKWDLDPHMTMMMMKTDKDERENSSIHCHHILIKHVNSRRPSSRLCQVITRPEGEAYASCCQLIGQINGFDDFKQLASELSDCSSGSNYGDLGWFSRGKMQPAFEQAAFRLQPGEMTKEPIKSDSGYHLIWRVA